VTEVPE